MHLRRGKDEDEQEGGGASGILEPQVATSVGSAVDEVVGTAAVFKTNARDVRMYSSCALYRWGRIPVSCLCPKKNPFREKYLKNVFFIGV